MAKNFLVDINLNKNELQNGVMQNLASDPSNPVKGQVYFNTTTNRFRVYTGTEWDEMGTGGGTVTSVGVSNLEDGGLTVTGSPITNSGTIGIGHTNVLSSAQTSSGIYPIKVDKNGHITEIGSALGVVSTTDDGLVPAINAGNTQISKITSGDKLFDATTGKYAELPDEAFSDTTYTDGTTGFVLKAKQDGEGNQIDTTYAPINNAALTGTPTAPKATKGDDSTKIATTSYVMEAIADLEGSMHYKGTIDQTSGLPLTGVKNGDTYKVAEAGTYEGQAAKIGDLFIAVVSSGSVSWTYIPSADDTAVTSITAGTGLTGGTITTTGTIALSNTLAESKTSGLYEIAIDQQGRITSATPYTLPDMIEKEVKTITGDAITTSFSINSNLNIRESIIQVYDGTTYDDVIVDIVRTSTSAVNINFATAPENGKTYKVVIIGLPTSI